MKIEKLSASSYNLAGHCQMAWFIQYGLGHQFPTPWKATIRGSLTHFIAQALAQIKKARQENLSKIENKILGSINVDEEPDIDQITKSYYDYYTTTEFKNYEWKPQDYKDIRKFIHVLLTHNNEQFNPLKSNIIDTEQYIAVEFDEEWALLDSGKKFKLTGFIDLIREVDSSCLEILDYKTSGKINDFYTQKEKTYKDFRRDIQLRAYHLALSKIYGCEKDYLVTVFFLKQAKPFTMSFNCDDIEETEKMIRERFEELKSCQNPRQNITPNCRWCDYYKNTFENTGIKPIVEFRDSRFSWKGQPMKMCDQTEYELSRHGLEWTEKNLSKVDK